MARQFESAAKLRDKVFKSYGMTNCSFFSWTTIKLRASPEGLSSVPNNMEESIDAEDGNYEGFTNGSINFKPFVCLYAVK